MKDSNGNCSRFLNQNYENMRRFFIAVALMLISVGTLSAQSKSNIRTELGVGIDAVYTGISSVSNSAVRLSPQLGYGAHFDFGIRFGNMLAVETEVAYQKGSLMASAVSAMGDKLKQKVNYNTVDIPVFLSLRFLNRSIRVYGGPLFTVMSKTAIKNSDELFGPMLPTWNLAVGAALRFSIFNIEARYVYPLTHTTNQFNGVEFDTKAYRLQLGVGVLF